MRFLWDRVGRGAGGILCDDMGLGKTVQVIGLMSAVYQKTGTELDRKQIIEMKLGQVNTDVETKAKEHAQLTEKLQSQITSLEQQLE